MTYQPITVHLPHQLYDRVRQRAQAKNRSLEAELIEAVTTGLTESDEMDDIAPNIATELAQLPFLADDDLWRAAQITVSTETANDMEQLLWKAKTQGLNKAETEEMERLQQLGHRIMLVRAEAALILQSRGYDIARLKPVHE